jgi:hypothetical protein
MIERWCSARCHGFSITWIDHGWLVCMDVKGLGSSRKCIIEVIYKCNAERVPHHKQSLIALNVFTWTSRDGQI